MKYCHKCHRLTAGKPLFCNSCGSSYDRKFCPRLHVNPRAAQVCSQCGSRELSSPQPRVPLVLRPVVTLLGLGPGFFILLLLVVWVAFYLRQLLSDPSGLLPLMLVALALGTALWLSLKADSRGRRKR